MKEWLKTKTAELMTARAFLYTVRHSSVSEEPKKDYWDKLSSCEMQDLLDNLSDPRDGERQHIKRILKELGATSVLDAGCGPATEYQSYRMNGLSEVRYVGADLSRRMLEEARRRYNGIQLVRSDVEELPFNSRSFDAVVIRHVLEHQPNGYEKTVREAVRVARKGVVVNFFLPPLPFGFDVKITGRGGVSTNWYNRGKFEKFALSLPDVTCFDLIRTPSKFGQLAAIYTLVK